jgi:glycosyltransferase involved in cell wall biosynthesis
MSSREPFISVITPCYNMGEFLGECIESVLRQTYTNFEYLLVNNCSTDNTLQIMHDYAKKDSRIRVHDNTEFLDVMVNHSHAMRFMSPESEWCKCISADDWLFPDCVRQMVEFGVEHPSAGIICCYSIEGSRILFQGLDYHTKVVNGREICRETLLGRQPYVFGAPTSLLYRADLIRSVPEFFVGGQGDPHADVSGVYNALQHSDFGFVHQILTYTRVHTGSQTSQSFTFGRINRALLSYMKRFGPIYLTEDEFKEQLQIFTDKYYDWLAAAMLENSFDQSFLEKQRKELASSNIELDTGELAKAGLRRGLQLVLHPVVTMTKLRSVRKRKGKVEARGADMT